MSRRAREQSGLFRSLLRAIERFALLLAPVSLLGGCAGASSHASGPTPAKASKTSSIARKAVFDAHVHLFRRAGDDGVGVEEILPVMDRAHVQRAVGLSAGYSKRDESSVRQENDYAAEQVKLARGRLIGFCGVHPLDLWAMPELERCVNQLGLRGLKLHMNEQRLDAANEGHRAAIEKMFDAAARLHVPVLIHVDKGAMPVYWMARQHKDTTVIFAHALSHEFRQLAYVAFDYAHARRRGWPEKIPTNIYFELSGTIPFYADSPERDTLAWYLRQIGVKQLLFGSDFPVYTPETSLAELAKYGFDDGELTAILNGNAERLFGPP